MDQQQQLDELKSKLAALKGQEAPADQKTITAPAVDPVLAERRAHFTGAQHRLADVLATGGRGIHGGNGFHLIDSNRSDVSMISDKLVVAQLIRLMLDDDGLDGIIYAVTNWNSKSAKTLSDRMDTHNSNHECDPAYRLGMQPSEKRSAYLKGQGDILKIPYTEPKPQTKPDGEALVRMASEEFAAFVIDFHRQVVSWDLKQFIFDNLKTPAKEFFDGFLALQKKADAEEESLFKNAMAAHVLATDPARDESDAEDFLDILAWVGQRSRLEDMRRQERIAKQKSRSATTVVPSQAPVEWAIKETTPKRSPLDGIDIGKVATFYDQQLAEIDAKLEQLKASGQVSTTGASA